MTLITVPDELSWTSADLELQGDFAVNRSRTGREQRLLYPGTSWLLTFTLPHMLESEARAWRSFLAGLRFGANEFLFGPPGYVGDYAGAGPLVKGAGQTGNILNCDGVTPSATILKDGQYFEVNGELKILRGDAIADGLGNVTFTFEPLLRQSPADNLTVETTSPKAKFRLAAPKIGWTYGLVNSQRMGSISAIEVIDA